MLINLCFVLFAKYADLPQQCKIGCAWLNNLKEVGQILEAKELQMQIAGNLDGQELEAHIVLFGKLLELNMPTPILPDVDGLHHDWELHGKKIQAKVSVKEIKQKCWTISHQEAIGKGKYRAASFGAYDALWVHCGDDQFVLLPASVLRRHSAFFGQGSSGKGRRTLHLYHGFSPKRGDAPNWKQICAKYVCSWADAGIKAKVEKILASC